MKKNGYYPAAILIFHRKRITIQPLALQFFRRLFVLHLHMPALSHPVKVVCWILFIVFMLLLTKNILFKKNPGYYKNYFRKEYRHYKVQDGWEKANTKPFSTIRLFYNSRQLNTEYKQNNLLGNMVGFIPFGFLLPLLLPWFRNIFKVLLSGFLLSLAFETAQLIFGLGVFDVDDLILNTCGSFAGYIFYFITMLFLRPRKKYRG
jgi:glycopeptide antibiotics resistance protein